MGVTLDEVASEARACTRCADLPLGPRPILRVSTTARLLIASQAPGTKVHASGVPWTDASGHRLRAWLDLTPDESTTRRASRSCPRACATPDAYPAAATPRPGRSAPGSGIPGCCR